MSTGTLYFVTDIEADGPSPLLNSMLSFGTVVVSERGEMLGEFEAVLQPRADRTRNPDTMRWWADQPEAWAAATTGAEPAEAVMPRFADWVDSFDGRRIFVARPLLFDGVWIDHYLQSFGQTRITDGPFRGRQIFQGTGLDISSYMTGLFGRTALFPTDTRLPADWLGGHPHTHRAIDDARGFAQLLARLLQIAADMPRHPMDVFGSPASSD